MVHVMRGMSAIHQPHARQERDAAAASEGGLVTFRQQLGFGIHVLVMMGTFYALGHYAAAHVSRSVAHVRTHTRTCATCNG